MKSDEHSKVNALRCIEPKCVESDEHIKEDALRCIETLLKYTSNSPELSAKVQEIANLLF